VAGMSVLAELTLPFGGVGGLVVAQKLVDADEEIETAENAIGLLGGRLKEVIPVAQKGLENRALVVVEKISRTPDRYPRRAGIPSKRPL
ncbi:MAG: 16S rRNA (guanine(527)-N(7))-methyltransferase RsmG, partial [Chloroflexi bacterium]|nr:16S rRNA (guanine(527)-N(7))-methyltransferase RsmG [Chloroflexota bacterium]